MDVGDDGQNDLGMLYLCGEGGFERCTLTAQRSTTVKNEGAYTDLTGSSMSS